MSADPLRAADFFVLRTPLLPLDTLEEWGRESGPGSWLDADPAEGADRDSMVDEIYEILREDYPKWWLPDDIEFIEEVPKTATGKFSKKDLREQYSDPFERGRQIYRRCRRTTYA